MREAEEGRRGRSYLRGVGCGEGEAEVRQCHFRRRKDTPKMAQDPPTEEDSFEHFRARSFPEKPPQRAQDRPKRAQRRPPKRAPRGPQEDLLTAQIMRKHSLFGSKAFRFEMAPAGPPRRQRGPRGFPRGALEGISTVKQRAQRGPRARLQSGPSPPKRAPRQPKRAPRWGPRGPQDHQEKRAPGRPKSGFKTTPRGPSLWPHVGLSWTFQVDR